jgi:trehalose utilization protein
MLMPAFSSPGRHLAHRRRLVGGHRQRGCGLQGRFYPRDINTAIAEGLKTDRGTGMENRARPALNDPEQGLPDDLLNQTDVLIWWGHKNIGDVKDALVSKIEARVKEGRMGFISLIPPILPSPTNA